MRVLVVDDHDLFRAGLARLLALQPDIEVVAQASSGHMGVRLAEELHPDVVLMDLRMPDLDGSEATRAILERQPSARVVALSVSVEEVDVGAAMQAGACGFLVGTRPSMRWSWPFARRLRVPLGSRPVPLRSCCEACAGRTRARCRSRTSRADLAARARGTAPDRPGDGEC